MAFILSLKSDQIRLHPTPAQTVALQMQLGLHGTAFYGK